MARYDESFVERILLIKELHGKRFLPLSVIKAVVTGSDAPHPAEVRALSDLDGRIFSETRTAEPDAPERLSDVAARTEIPASELRQFAAIGVMELETRDGGQWLDPESVRIAEHWGNMRRNGFTPERGFGPEKLHLHVDFIEWLVREELRIFSAGITGRVGTAEAARMAEHGIDDLNAILSILRRRTLLRNIAAGNVPDDASDAYPASQPKAS